MKTEYTYIPISSSEILFVRHIFKIFRRAETFKRYIYIYMQWGHAVVQLVETQRYKPHYGLRVDSASNRTISWRKKASGA